MKPKITIAIGRICKMDIYYDEVEPVLFNATSFINIKTAINHAHWLFETKYVRCYPE